MKVFTTLGSHYTQLGSKAFGSQRKELLEKADKMFNKAESLQLYTSKDNLVGRGYLYLAVGDLPKAERNFKYVMASIAPDDIPALLGNACLQFNQAKYTDALDTYRKVLRLHPNCPASVRVGIGMCFARMKHPEKAREAFTRALELEPTNATALVGTAVLHANEKTPEAMKRALRTLKKAYDADNSNPLTLNQLAEHFFRKNEFKNTLKLARVALKHTEIDHVKAESHYHIARVLHAQGEYDEAFRHYYQATKLYKNFPLADYGLGQIYLRRQKRVEAIECFEKVRRSCVLWVIGGFMPFGLLTTSANGWLEAQQTCDPTSMPLGRSLFLTFPPKSRRNTEGVEDNPYQL
jgi:RNA polymerase-associated protein CTR9